jgi:hypothetical protein
MLWAGPVVPEPPAPTTGGGEPSVLIPLVIAVVVLYVMYRLFKRLWRERKGGPEDDSGWNWRGWNGPNDWPVLPRSPKGTGPTPDYVPDEWVWEQFGDPPRRLTKVAPPKDEV